MPPLRPFPVPLRVVRAGLDVRRRVFDLADSVLPAEGALYDLVAGMQRTMLAGVLVTSGLADALGAGARDPAELVHVDRGGRARLSRVGAPLRRDHPRSIASWVAYQASPVTARAHAELEAQLREGAEPSGHRRAHGNSVWDYFSEHPDEGARFGNAMRELTAIDVAAVTRAYPWPRKGVICDVAGGIGTLLAAVLERRPKARGVLIEGADVLAEAEGFLRSRGLAERVERRPGDLFGELDARADVYILKWILHDWSDDACLDILRRVRATMPSGATVVAIGQNQRADWPSPVTAMVDLLMLVVCEGGRERSPEEVHALMRDAGLEPGRVKQAGLQVLVEGTAR
jgi:hypothetical protein